jgi:hypothetical protein
MNSMIATITIAEAAITPAASQGFMRDSIRAVPGARG